MVRLRDRLAAASGGRLPDEGGAVVGAVLRRRSPGDVPAAKIGHYPDSANRPPCRPARAAPQGGGRSREQSAAGGCGTCGGGAGAGAGAGEGAGEGAGGGGGSGRRNAGRDKTDAGRNGAERGQGRCRRAPSNPGPTAPNTTAPNTTAPNAGPEFGNRCSEFDARCPATARGEARQGALPHASSFPQGACIPDKEGPAQRYFAAGAPLFWVSSSSRPVTTPRGRPSSPQHAPQPPAANAPPLPNAARGVCNGEFCPSAAARTPAADSAAALPKRKMLPQKPIGRGGGPSRAYRK